MALPLTVFLAGMGSCSSSLQQACNSSIPEFQDSVDHAITVLSAWDPPIARLPASSDGAGDASGAIDEPSEPTVAFSDRESWERWAESRLVEVQHYIDLADEAHAKSAKSNLSQVANDFVMFHGLAQQGKLDGMIGTLRRIDSEAASARQSACGSGNFPPDRSSGS